MKPPTQEQVSAHFIEKHYYNAEKEAIKFWNRYDSIGWVVGKARTPMIRWKSAAANWNENAIEYAKERGLVVERPVPKSEPSDVKKKVFAKDAPAMAYLFETTPNQSPN